MYRCVLTLGCCLAMQASVLAKPILTAADFEEFALGPETFVNDHSSGGGFTSGGAFFNNSFTDFGGGFTSWEGFAVSNQSDTTTVGFGNQGSAIAGSGFGGNGNYAIGFPTTFTLPAARISLPNGTEPVSLQVTNTTYAFLAMRDGDDGFGAVSGPFGSGDFLELAISGLDETDTPVGSIDFPLADFRGGAGNYILDDWTEVDLSPLQGLGVTALEFSISGSDVGPFGLNTPGFFALDNLVTSAESPPVAPEPGTLGLLALGLVAAGLAYRHGANR